MWQCGSAALNPVGLGIISLNPSKVWGRERKTLFCWAESRVQPQPGTSCPISPAATQVLNQPRNLHKEIQVSWKLLQKGKQEWQGGPGRQGSSTLKSCLWLIYSICTGRISAQECLANSMWQAKEAPRQVHLFLAQCTANSYLEARTHFPDHIWTFLG